MKVYFCFLFVCQAINVTVSFGDYVYNNDPDAATQGYRFYHGWNDRLLMEVWLNNMQPGVTADIVTDTDTPKQISAHRTSDRQIYFLVQMPLLSETSTSIYVNICLDGSCIRKKLAEGVFVKRKSSVKDVCLRDIPCQVEVNMTDEPSGKPSSITMPKPTMTKQNSYQTGQGSSNNARSETRRTYTARARETKTFRHPKQIRPLAIPLAPNNLQEESRTSKDVTTVILSVVCTVGFIMLVVGIRKRCNCTCDAGIYQPRINYLKNRFYVNMLFRKECDAEIREIEQHKYEEIERHYEEIK
ncbi:uncharacterized protein LOC110378490 [Helicoverpa armigera]|uniref:uncharacterized protein LOC110378490 n=1 Tax=Helicoverpa armigera TaxID=29058 RepID=UPI0030839EA9